MDTARRGLLLVMMGVEPAFEDDFNRWYNEEHFPERMACPGFLGGQRFVAVEGTPKYLALYDLESPAVLESEAYRKISPQSPWTRRVLEHVSPSVRNVYVEATPPGLPLHTSGSGNGLLSVMIDVDPEHEEELCRWWDEEHMQERMAIAGFLRARRFVALEGRPRYLALYDLESPETVQSEEYKLRFGAASSPWTQRLRPLFKPLIRNIYRQLLSGQGPAR